MASRPVPLISRVLKHTCALPPSERIVLLCLTEYVNRESGVAWPAVSTLAADANLSRRWTRKLLRELEAKQLVLMEPREGRSNRYHLARQLQSPEPAPELQQAEAGGNATTPLRTTDPGTHDPTGRNSSDQTPVANFRRTPEEPLKEPLTPRGPGPAQGPDPRDGTLNRDPELLCRAIVALDGKYPSGNVPPNVARHYFRPEHWAEAVAKLGLRDADWASDDDETSE